MTSAETEQTIVVKTEGPAAAAGTGPAAGKEGWKCPISDHHVHRDDLRKIWKECREESFWYRALPLSVGSMAVTGGLIYNGVWKSSKRFGPFPKLAVAGILGYLVGKASYAGTCRSKFQKLGVGEGPGFGGFGPGFGPWSEGGRFGPPKHAGHGHSIITTTEELKCVSMDLSGAAFLSVINATYFYHV
ncbi:OCIA domain-containing protein 2, partial [Nibea albiflora]